MHDDSPPQPPQSDPHPTSPKPKPRRFVYRAVTPEVTNHPLRRSTDTPRPFQGVAGELSPRVHFVKMRVYLKLN